MVLRGPKICAKYNPLLITNTNNIDWFMTKMGARLLTITTHERSISIHPPPIARPLMVAN